MKHASFHAEIHDDLGHLHALGHGAISLFNAVVLLAVVAVVLSTRSMAPQMITAFTGLVAWLVKQVVTPISGGYSVPLDATLAPAFGGTTSSSPTSSTGSGSGAPATNTPGITSNGGSGGSSSPQVVYPVVDPQTGIVTGSSTTPLFPGQFPYTGINPNGSPVYTVGPSSGALAAPSGSSGGSDGGDAGGGGSGGGGDAGGGGSGGGAEGGGGDSGE